MARSGVFTVPYSVPYSSAHVHLRMQHGDAPADREFDNNRVPVKKGESIVFFYNRDSKTGASWRVAVPCVIVRGAVEQRATQRASVTRAPGRSKLIPDRLNHTRRDSNACALAKVTPLLADPLAVHEITRRLARVGRHTCLGLVVCQVACQQLEVIVQSLEQRFGVAAPTRWQLAHWVAVPAALIDHALLEARPANW